MSAIRRIDAFGLWPSDITVRPAVNSVGNHYVLLQIARWK